MSPLVPRRDLVVRPAPARGPLRRLLTKEPAGFDIPGQAAGWNRAGGSMRGITSPRQIKDYLSTYGGTQESIVWVYACVSLIAAEGASYPWELTRQGQHSEILAENEIPADLKALLDKPNQRMTYFDFTEFVYTDLELAGNSYWLKDNMTRDGKPERLMRLRPDLVEIAVSRADEVAGYVYTVGSTRIPLELDEVIHFKYPSPMDGDKYGMGTVEAIQRTLGIDLDETQHIQGFFASGARISGILTTSEPLSEDQWLRLKQDFEAEFGVQGNNRFGILIAEQGVGYSPVNVSPAGSGVLELKRMGKDEILSAFGVPEFLLGGIGQGGVYRMSEAQFIFGRNMKPKAIRFQERMEQDLVLPGWELNFVVDPKYAEPPDTKIARAGMMLGKGSSLNQLLDAQDQPPIDDPRADEPLIQLGVMPWSMMMQQTAAQIRAAAAGADAAEQANQGGGAGGGLGAPSGPDPFYAGLDSGGGGNGYNPGSDVLGSGANGSGDLTSFAARGNNGRGTGSGVGGSSTFFAGLSVPEYEPMVAPRPRSRHPQAPKPLMREAGQKGLLHPTGVDPTVIDFPAGFESRDPEMRAQHTDQEIVDAVLHHQGKVYRDNVGEVQRAMRDFFIGQRKRIIHKLGDKGVVANVILAPQDQRYPKKQVNIEKLWNENIENNALAQTYLPLVDDIAAQAVNVARIAGSGLRWDLQNPLVAKFRNILAKQITRINDTTRQKVADTVEEGMRRGYSVSQIANGFPDESYDGIQGVFDQAGAARAETIARTETALIYNHAALAGYQDGGIERVEVIDGTGDDECRIANGQSWTLEEATANPIAHPNCVRSFAPIVSLKASRFDAKAWARDVSTAATASTIQRGEVPFEHTHTFARAWKSDTYANDFSYGDRLMSDLAHEYGFDGEPDLITAQAVNVYAAQGEQEIFLPMETPERVEALLTGDPFYALGITGNGIAAVKSARVAREHAGPAGIIIRATLKRKANVAELSVVEALLRDETKTWWEKAQEGDLRAKAFIAVAKNPGRWAMTQGYDAIYDDRHDSFVILNVTALRVQREAVGV